jgi:thioredoxin 1
MDILIIYNPMSIIHINSTNEFDDMIKTSPSTKCFLVDFYTDWCGPCKRIAPTLEKFAKTYSTVTFLKVNTDELPDLADRYDIKSIPTFLIFKGGSTVAQYQPIKGADSVKIENLLKMITGTSIQSNDF